jgi:hypothetical protein
MDESREALGLSERFLQALERRQKAAEEWNAQLGTAKPPLRKRLVWRARAIRTLPERFEAYGSTATIADRRSTLEEEWRQHSGKKYGSVTWALNDIMTGFWAGGLFKVAGDTGQLMSPLVVKALIKFSQASEWSCMSRAEVSVCGKGQRDAAPQHRARRRDGTWPLGSDDPPIRVPASILLPIHGNRCACTGYPHLGHLQAFPFPHSRKSK